MMKNPSRKQSKIFVLIIPPVIRIHNNKWEVILILVWRSRTPRGMRTVIIPQVIQLLLFGEWEAAVV